MVALTRTPPDESLTAIAEVAVRRALEGLIQLMEDPDVPAETRRKAATDALRYLGAAAARFVERPSDGPRVAPPTDFESPAQSPGASRRDASADLSPRAAADALPHAAPAAPAMRLMASSPLSGASTPSADARGDPCDAINGGGVGSARAREPPTPP